MPSLSYFRPLYLVLLAALTALGGLVASLVSVEKFEMSVQTSTQVLTVDDQFIASVIVRSEEPTNVFSGTLLFDSEYLSVEKIDYNTSIADLWAVEPWYSDGAGTITYAGGTTNAEGYVGEDSLLTVTFRPLQTGATNLGLEDVRILRHDGLGTEVNASAPLDVIFTIEPAVLDSETVLRKSIQGPTVQVLPQRPDVDLNKDGRITTADYSVFMVHLASQNLRSDFNNDGRVTISDLSILTQLR